MLAPDDPILSYQPLWGTYEAVELLGFGSFGRVYRARRTDSAVFESAVKLIRIPQDAEEIEKAKKLGMGEAGLYQHFEAVAQSIAREIRLLYSLRGEPNIVAYEDHALLHEDGRPEWTVLLRMELLTPLTDYLEAQSMGPEEVRRLGLQMCAALTACERAGIVHRDIKEANVFVAENGRFKLGDFGVARASDHPGGAAVLGTPAYLAPEALGGKPCGAHTDIYALGIMLYRLLNEGRYPFLPPPPASIDPKDIESAIMRRVRGEAIPPPARGNDLLKSAVLKACAFNPQNRHENAAAFRMALTRGAPPVAAQTPASARESDMPPAIPALPADPEETLAVRRADEPSVRAALRDREDGGTAARPRRGFLRVLNMLLIGALTLAIAGIFVWRTLPWMEEASPAPAATHTEIEGTASATRTAAPTPLPSVYDEAALNAMSAKNGGKLAVHGDKAYVSRNSAESGGGVLVFDGGTLTERRLLPGRNVGSLCVYENRLYYADDGAQGRLGYVSLVTGAGVEFAGIIGARHVQAFENRIYYAVAEGADDSQGIWSVRSNGEEVRRVLAAEGVRNLCVYDGYCYWIGGDGSLCRLSLEELSPADKGEPETLHVGPVDDYALFGDGLLVSAGGLIRMGLDGSSPIAFSPLRAEQMLIMDGRLFYANPEANDTLMLLHLDESDPLPIYQGEISRLGSDAHALFFSTEAGAADGKITSLSLGDPAFAR